MKAIYLFLMLALVHTAGAQDFCSLLKKEVSADKTTFDFASPFDPSDIPAVRVTRNYNTNPDEPTDNFYIILQIAGDNESIYTKTDSGELIEKDEKSLVIEFDDKSKIVDDAIKISHDHTDDKLQSIRYVYYPVTDEKIKDLTTKKISKFSLAGYVQTVPPDSANAVMHYIQCIKAAH